MLSPDVWFNPACAFRSKYGCERVWAAICHGSRTATSPQKFAQTAVARCTSGQSFAFLSLNALFDTAVWFIRIELLRNPYNLSIRIVLPVLSAPITVMLFITFLF